MIDLTIIESIVNSAPVGAALAHIADRRASHNSTIFETQYSLSMQAIDYAAQMRRAMDQTYAALASRPAPALNPSPEEHAASIASTEQGMATIGAFIAMLYDADACSDKLEALGAHETAQAVKQAFRPLVGATS